MTYGKNFYAGQQASSGTSAKAIVPILIDQFHPTSVVDVGCGTGGWLREFLNAGVQEVLGLDGNWVEPEMLLVPKNCFKSADLTSPPAFERKFSMAVSVEVAEHLPESAARNFVKYLTELAPVVVFSAAVPRQGGTAHVNEQWQTYWLRLFSEFKFHPLDIVRQKVWNNPDVCWWYAQNLIVYASRDQSFERPSTGCLIDVVHPRFLSEALQPENLPPQLVFTAVPGALKKVLRKLLRRNER